MMGEVADFDLAGGRAGAKIWVAGGAVHVIRKEGTLLATTGMNTEGEDNCVQS